MKLRRLRYPEHAYIANRVLLALQDAGYEATIWDAEVLWRKYSSDQCASYLHIAPEVSLKQIAEWVEPYIEVDDEDR